MPPTSGRFWSSGGWANKNLNKQTLELRHQRNTDAFFDVFDESKRNGISQLAIQKIYDIMETMLPKSAEGDAKLVELFGEAEKPRSGWVVFTEKE